MPPVLDLKTGLSRARHDVVRERVFVTNPFELSIIDVAEAEWIEELSQRVAAGTSIPGPIQICDVPKPGHCVRPGAILRIDDAAVYAALGYEVQNAVYDKMQASTRHDYAYTMLPPKEGSQLFESYYLGWKRFSADSIANIDSGASVVVTADIAGYYEHIDLAILMSDLLSLGVANDVVSLLSKILNTWSQPSGRGLPQGHNASDLLAKIYLMVADNTLRGDGLKHVRFVDDFRIFCGDIGEAREAVRILTRVLRSRGLSLQTAKLKLIAADDARVSFRGVQPMLDSMAQKYRARLEELLASANPYMMLEDVEMLARDILGDDVPIGDLEDYYRQEFMADNVRFNSSLFHFLLNRLANARSTFAAEDVVGMLAEHPEETAAILRYLTGVGMLPASEAALIEFLGGERRPYDYQTYQILSALLAGDSVSETTIGFARSQAFDSKVGYVRSVARALLGKFAGEADLQRLQAAYGDAGGPSEHVDIVCAVRRMEKSRRNAFYARVASQGDQVRRAVTWSKRSN